jgi:hypothetical protein
MKIQGLVFWLILAGLTGQQVLALQETGLSFGNTPLAILLTDESIYLCPLCGDRFLAAFRQLSSRIGKGRIWVAVSGVKTGQEADAAELISAVKKRIQAFLRSNGVVCPVMDDSGGALRGPGGNLPACVVFDVTSGSVRSFALSQIRIRQSRKSQKLPIPAKLP